MPYKFENDSIVLDDNKNPIWVHDDGKEAGVNFAGALSSIKELSEKNKTFKTQLSEYENKLKNFEGLDPEKARQAVDTIAKLDQGKLIDAGKRDEAIQKAIEAKENEWKSKHQSVESAFTKAQETLKNKDAMIFNLMVSQKFSQSEFLNKNTTMTPDVAALKFGQQYKIEDVDGELKPVAYLRNEKVYSLKNPGKLADFDESFKILWESYEYKNNYMKDIPGGSGSQGGHGGQASGKDIVLRGADALNPTIYRNAKIQAEKHGGRVIIQK